MNTDSDRTGRLGVHGVATLILGEFGWLLREQHESDYGIDAIVETTVDGLPTGKLFAIQIKSGPSYFNKAHREDGWVLRGPKRHLSYWLEYQLPVLVVLFDTRTSYGYWAHVNHASARFTSNGYRIDIPVTQVLDASAKQQIEEIASQTALTPAELTKLEGQHRSIAELISRYRPATVQDIGTMEKPRSTHRAGRLDDTSIDATILQRSSLKGDVSGQGDSHIPVRRLTVSAGTANHEGLSSLVWRHFNTLRNDMSIIEYVEQISYLLLLRLAHEKVSNEGSQDERLALIDSAWQSLLGLDGEQLTEEYSRILRRFSQLEDPIHAVFRGASNRISDATILRKLISDLNTESWSGERMEIGGAAYKDMLRRVAKHLTSSAGQYFTPRNIIRSMVDCIQPGPGDTVIDPACGTGGFLIAAHEYVERHNKNSLATPEIVRRASHRISGIELAKGPAQLATMNLLLHGIDVPGKPSAVEVRDALAEPPSRHASVVLSNPPWGNSQKIEPGYARNDFWATTASKELNFVQNIVSMLDIDGRAAVVLPDSVLFGRGSAEIIRRNLLRECTVHTLLRLPADLLYGNKSNILFFDKKSDSPGVPQTSTLWVYDARSGQRLTHTCDRLAEDLLDDFTQSYRPGEPVENRVETMRFRPFSYEELLARDGANLDITWLAPEGQGVANLRPAINAKALIEDLDTMIIDLAALMESLTQFSPRSPSAE